LKKERDEDPGIGTLVLDDGQRFIKKNGEYNIQHKGISIFAPYQWLVEMAWWKFLLIVPLYFVVVNIFFALLFLWAGIDGITNVDTVNPLRAFEQCFFFSVQTFSTVGFGYFSPESSATNWVATIVAFSGLVNTALATGLFFARFSRPQAQVLFSEYALISPYEGGRSLQFRLAHKRSNKLIDLTMAVTLTWVEKTPKGRKRRRFHKLELERDHISLFPLNWTVVHPIDSNSPFYEMSEQECQTRRIEVIVIVKGFDETFSQTVHASTSYVFDEILWKKQFLPMYYVDQREGIILDLNKIDDVETVDLPTA